MMFVLMRVYVVHIVMLFIVYMSVSFCRTYVCNCYVKNKYSAVNVSWLVIKCCAMYYYCAQDIGEYYETWDAVLGYTGELQLKRGYIEFKYYADAIHSISAINPLLIAINNS